MNPLARRALLELALEDIVAMVRGAVDRNRRGDGRPATGFADAALALKRFDDPGGFAVLCVDLWRDELGGDGRRAPARSGQLPSAGEQPEPSGAARSGALRPPASGQPRLDQ